MSMDVISIIIHKLIYFYMTNSIDGDIMVIFWDILYICIYIYYIYILYKNSFR